MITHGNKRISEIVYARKASEGGGAVRLTNIIRGAQVVFGGLSPSPSTKWLTGATMAAILAAFGQTDGKAVIKATNAYLNALAETDPTKASALAGFINEDPMLVCSLVDCGVRRYCVITNTSSADSYKNGVNLPYKLNEIVKLEMDGYFARGNNYMLFTALSGNNIESPWLGTASSSGFSNVSRTNFNNPGVDGDTKVVTFTCSSKSYAHMFSWIDYNWNLETMVRRIGIFGADGQLMQLIPYVEKGTVYLLDLMDMTRKLTQSRVTPFTIAYTLPDGTPWTPLNQTP